MGVYIGLGPVGFAPMFMMAYYTRMSDDDDVVQYGCLGATMSDGVQVAAFKA